MEVEEAACIWVLYQQWKQHKKKPRRYWVHPILQDRMTHGIFSSLYPKLREQEQDFFNYLGMSIKSFDDLLEQIKEHITSTNTTMRDSICAEEKLLITLRYLTTGCSLTDLHYGYRLGISTISGILRHVCAIICTKLKNVYIPAMTKERWEKSAIGFEKYAHFPNCIGALEGKHIRLTQPTDSLYYNKKNYSTVLLAVCDTNYSFLYIDIGAYGYFSDSTVFQNSKLYKELLENSLDFPDAKPISSLGKVSVPHVFAGSDYFTLMEHIMRPYSGRLLTYEKNIFNYRLSKAHQYVECTLGMLANKWRIFSRPINVNVDFAHDIIKACCVLHNYVVAKDGYNFEDTLFESSFANLIREYAQRGTMSALSARARYADYFTGEGKVEWQDRMI